MKRYELGSNEHGAPDMVAYDHGDYVLFDDHDAEVDRLNARIAELEAIVAELPATADGVPIEIGGVVWDTVVTPEAYRYVTGVTVYADGEMWVHFAKHSSPSSRCYSNRQAAEAAKGA